MGSTFIKIRFYLCDHVATTRENRIKNPCINQIDARIST